MPMTPPDPPATSPATPPQSTKNAMMSRTMGTYSTPSLGAPVATCAVPPDDLSHRSVDVLGHSEEAETHVHTSVVVAPRVPSMMRTVKPLPVLARLDRPEEKRVLPAVRCVSNDTPSC